MSDRGPRDGEFHVQHVVVVVEEGTAGGARRARAGDLLEGISGDRAVRRVEEPAGGIVRDAGGIEEVDPAVHEDPEIVGRCDARDREDAPRAELRAGLDNRAGEVLRAIEVGGPALEDDEFDLRIGSELREGGNGRRPLRGLPGDLDVEPRREPGAIREQDVAPGNGGDEEAPRDPEGELAGDGGS